MVDSLGGAVSISARILTPFNLPHHCSWVSAFSFLFFLLLMVNGRTVQSFEVLKESDLAAA